MIVSNAEILTLLGLASSATEADLGLIGLLHPKAEATVKTFLQNDVEYKQHVEFLPARNQFSEANEFVDVDVSATTVTLVPSSRNNHVLQLKHTPVWLASLEVREDPGAYGGQVSGSFATATILVSGTDYYLDVCETLADVETGDGGNISRTGHLIRIGAWSAVARSVKVTYYGGWKASQLDTIVSDIKLAVIEMVTRAYATAKMRGRRLSPVVSERIGKTAVVYSEAITQAALASVSSVPSDIAVKLQPYRHYGRQN